MRYVKHVKSNVKGKVDVELGPKTLIVGPNRAGKSAIVNSIELALTGDASDVVGRSVVKDGNMILSMASGEGLASEVTLDDDTVISGHMVGKLWTWLSQPAGAYDPATVFPLRAIREAMLGSANTTRSFFLQYAVGRLAREDILNALPSELHKAFEQACPKGSNVTGPDLLIETLENAEKRLRELRKEVKTRSEATNELGSGLDAPPGADELLSLKSHKENLENAYRNGIAARGAHERWEATQASLSKKREYLNTLRVELAHWSVELDAITESTEMDTVKAAHEELLRYATAKHLATCPTCKQSADAEAWGPRLEKVIEANRARRAALSQREQLMAQGSNHERLIQMIEAEISDTHFDAGGTPEYPSEDDLQRLQAQINEVATTYESLRVKASQWEMVKKSKNQAASAAKQIGAWELLIKELKASIATNLAAGTSTFEGRVQAYLPDDLHFAIRLHEGGREVCRLGYLQGDGSLHTALSGAEWATMQTALGAAIVGDSEKLHVLVAEDRGWDAVTLASVMTALSNASGQVIIPTTTYPAHVPAGWTVVNLGIEDVHPEDVHPVQTPGQKIIQALSEAVEAAHDDLRIKPLDIQEVKDPVVKAEPTFTLNLQGVTTGALTEPVRSEAPKALPETHVHVFDYQLGGKCECGAASEAGGEPSERIPLSAPKKAPVAKKRRGKAKVEEAPKPPEEPEVFEL